MSGRSFQCEPGFLVGVMFITSLALPALDKVQPLNIKVGLWEVTTTMAKSGSIPIPAEMLARLTPEQRARVEERMKASATDTTKVTTRTYCLTRNQLAKGTTFGEDPKACSRTVLISTPRRVNARIDCVSQGVKSKGALQVEALDPENIRGAINLIATDGHSSSSTSTFTAEWVSPVCK